MANTTRASSTTGPLSQFLMSVAESSQATGERQQEQEEVTNESKKGRLTALIGAATPNPTPATPQSENDSEARPAEMEGFHADDEEKGSPVHRSRTTPISAATSSSTSRKSKKSKKTMKKAATTTTMPPSKRPTMKERLHLAMVLQNTGSTARDHLATERTFLAYVNTSLALASTGVALVQLFTIADLTSSQYNVPSTAKDLQHFARPLGATSILLAMLVLLIGMTRYFTVQTALIRGMFPTARTCIVFITVVLLTITIIVFVVLLAGRRS